MCAFCVGLQSPLAINPMQSLVVHSFAVSSQQHMQSLSMTRENVKLKTILLDVDRVSVCTHLVPRTEQDCLVTALCFRLEPTTCGYRDFLVLKSKLDEEFLKRETLLIRAAKF
jgi:hypothetical protein